MPAPHTPPPKLSTPPLAGLEAYRAVEESSRHMLAAAQAAQWARFWQLGLLCRQQVQALQQHPKPANPAEHTAVASTRQSEKHAILLRILQNDALIRALTEPGSAAPGAFQAGGFNSGFESTQLH